MKSVTSLLLMWAWLWVVGVPCSLAGDNAGATVSLSEIEAEGDTLSYGVLVGSAVKTRVVHLMFGLPDHLEFLSWEDGAFIGDPLRIGPHFHEPTRRVLVALATIGTNVVTESSGAVGTAKFLRTAAGEGEISLLEACLVDDELREDCVATPEAPIQPAPRLAQDIPVPDVFALRTVSPNPAVRSATVRFEIPRPGSHVKIKIYNVRGRKIRTLANEHRPPGYYTEVWDLTNDQGYRIAPGIYFCRMEAGEFKETKKVILLK